MGYLKDISNQPKQQTFPGSTFEIAEDVPQSQCSEALIEGDSATTGGIPCFLTDPGKFAGFHLAGKKVTITASVGGWPGTYDIASNNDNTLELIQDAGNGDPVEYYCHNGGSLILTRDLQSFAQFIKNAGAAYTIKGGKLYTNIPLHSLQPACTIVFNPIT